MNHNLLHLYAIIYHNIFVFVLKLRDQEHILINLSEKLFEKFRVNKGFKLFRDD